jgi:hypothetical protein
MEVDRLRDGVRLAQMLNAVYPQLELSPLQESPQSKGTMVINISEILKALRDHGLLPVEMQHYSCYTLLEDG